MKIKMLITALFLTVSMIGFSQNINWRRTQSDRKHQLYLHAGLDYGLTFGVGYGYRFKTKLPMLLNVDYSFPSGKNAMDDLKTKIGIQMEWIQIGHFSSALKAYGLFRRFENSYAKMVNFGSEFSGTAGYYTARWFIAGEFGFDKAIVTHIKHLQKATENNPSLQNGWYLPTGGNFFYDLQGGVSFRKTDITLKTGKVVNQDFKTTPLLPFYAQLGWSRHF